MNGTETWALIDTKNEFACLFPCKPVREGNTWITGDQYMQISISLLQKFARHILGREMTEEDNPLHLI